MEDSLNLVNKFNVLSDEGVIKNDLPDFVLDNLNQKFSIREYQKEAFGRLRYYLDDYRGKQSPAHLLFHMATGIGKTLVMAADMLYLYSQGYRNFVFFVNSTSIIKKTQINFLEKSSSKYLFADRIKFNDREIEIKQVKNFETANSNNINILFTTIQGLHSDLNTPKENNPTYEDFDNTKVVFLSDEAHHINAMTKAKLDKDEIEESTSWEKTVHKIFNANKQNIMLEYTATVELKHPNVVKKYNDKIIYQYTLKNFREDGYSKDVALLQSDWDVSGRALQAVILSQYRRKIAEKNKVQLKPVILFKSKQIKDSQEFEQVFYEMIKNLKISDIRKIAVGGVNSIMGQVFSYFSHNKINLANLIKEIKADFAPEKCLIINSKQDGDDKQIKVNTLEDYNNETRVIFTTNMLNEGWDVLNLFDIVRLYETRDAKAGKAGSTTIAEAQLIGRGARYFPFQLNDEQIKDKRKYDKDLDNELRILEELHYHSLTDSRYIAELRNELVNIGIATDNKVTKITSIKNEIKETDFWKTGLVFMNQVQKRDFSKVKSLFDIAQNTVFTHKIKTGHASELDVFGDDQTLDGNSELKRKKIKLNEIEPHILRKAIDKIDAYKFDRLTCIMPNLKSVAEFMASADYVGMVEVEILANNGKVDNLNNSDKLEIALAVLKELHTKIIANNAEYVGTKEFTGHDIRVIAKTQKLEILIGGEDKEYGRAMTETLNDDLRLDLSTQDWYMYNENYGTSEEKYLIKFIKFAIDDLRKKYNDVYLLRNERLFKIYRFSDGKAIEPDFVLFAKTKGSKKSFSYQLFIEPKGNRGLVEDKWKEDFLKEIEAEFKLETLFEDKDKYRLIGLPFYNEQNTKQEFDQTFREKLAL